MSKKQKAPASQADYSVVSLPTQPLAPEEEQSVRNVISEAAPGIRPSTVVVLPHESYRDIANRVSHGQFGNTRVGNGPGSEEDTLSRATFAQESETASVWSRWVGCISTVTR